MKISILDTPQEDIFKDRSKYIFIFIALLTLSCFGLFLGGYAIIAKTSYYSQLEKWSLIFFFAPTPFTTYIGEKLQKYKKLTPPQREELAVLSQQYPEVKVYCDLVSEAGRQPIRAEYRACKTWAEEASRHAH